MNIISKRENWLHYALYAELTSSRIIRRVRDCHKWCFNELNRDLTPLLEVFNAFGLKIAPRNNYLIISKEKGDYQINLQNSSVRFTPAICLKCYQRQGCIYIKRKLCIIETSRGWVNIALSEIDLFILSIVFAILHDLLPEDLLEQIRNLSGCLQKKSNMMTLDERLLQDFRKSFSLIEIENTLFPQAPPIQGPLPPPLQGF